MYPLQSDFKVGHSTETAVLMIVDALTSARPAYQSVLILLDLLAALNSVNHQITLETLC